MSSFIPSSILIFGATGQIGYFITEAILAATPAFGKVAIFTSQGTLERKADLINKWKAKGVSIIVGDVTNAGDVSAAYNSVDTVISAVGRNVLSHQIDLIKLAEASGSVKWFFPSEYGTDIEHNPKSATERPHQVKLAVRKLMREQVTSLKITYLVTGPFFDMWARGYFNPEKKEANLVEDGEGRIGFCTMSDVGKFAVAALRHPEVSFDKALKVQSFIVTPNQVLAEFEKQTGGEKWKVTYRSLAAVREEEERLWTENSPMATVATLRRIWAEGGTLYEQNDNDLLGLTDADLEGLDVAVKRDLGLA